MVLSLTIKNEHKMKRIIAIIVILYPILFFSCEPRIEMDMEQWGDQAFIENVQLFKLEIKDSVKLQEWYENQTVVTGVRHTTISSGAAEIDQDAYIATVKLNAGEDITRVGIQFWHKARLIEPLDGAPKAGTINDFSDRSFKYRLYSADGTIHDWTVNITD